MPTKKELLETAEKRGVNVSSNNTKAEIEAALKQNEGKKTFKEATEASTQHVNGKNNGKELSVDDQKKIEKELSTKEVKARVIVSTGSFLKVKFYKNNKVAGSFNTMGYDGDLGTVKEYVNSL